MPTFAEIDVMNAHLDLHPDDSTARGVLADMLEDVGDPRAEGQRALGWLRLLPDEYEGLDLPITWWGFTDCFNRGVSGCLPRDWFESLEGGELEDPGCPGEAVNRDYLTLREATDAAAEAFSKLPADRRASLLRREG